MLQVFLLGEQRILHEEAVSSGSGSRSFELLGYLVLHAGVAVARQYLAGLLWPNSTDQQALTNLRRELHNLRNVLGDGNGLRLERSRVTWIGSPGCRVDVSVYNAEREAAEAARGRRDGNAFLAHALQAIDVYRGDFLPGVFTDWVLEQRDGLRRACTRLLDQAAEALRETDDLQRAVELARRRVRLEPLEESGYRLLMELQADTGDRGAAMTTFHRCSAMLEQELGVAPDPSTTALMGRLLAADDRPPQQRLHRSAAGPPGPPLADRGRELAQLEARWRLALTHQPGLMLITGEAGVGKTRLAAELAAQVRASGAVVAQSRCFNRPGRTPLAPVADWLRSPMLASSLSALAPVWRDEVNRLLPGTTSAPVALPSGSTAGSSTTAATLLARSDAPPTSRAVVDAWQRRRFFEGLARAVLASDRPVLLVLDDLQWGDAETLSWLAFLLSFAPQTQLLVVATARADELDQAPDLRAVLRPIESKGLVTRLGLEPLGMEATATLSASLTGRKPETVDAALTYAATGGYPLYIVEAARMLPEGAASGPARATGLESVLHRRLDQASDLARSVAGLAAAFGRDISLELLNEAGDMTMPELVAAVDELWRLRILRTQGRGYDFVHDLLREAAYEAVSPARRWLLHRRLAQALQVLYADRLDDVAAQLGEQYSLGGQEIRALQHFRRAGDISAAVFANGEALKYYRRCLDIVATLPSGANRLALELEVLRAMSAPLTALHGYSSLELESTMERTAELAQQLNQPKVLVSALIGLFASRFVEGATSDSFRIAERALGLAQPHPDLLGQAHFAYAGAALSLGNLQDAITHFDRAIELSLDRFSHILGTKLEVHARAWAAHAHWLAGDDDGAVALCEDALQRGRAAGHPYSLAIALAYASVLHQLRHDVVALESSAAELQELCHRYDFAYYGQWGAIMDGWRTGGQPGAEAVRSGIRALRAQRAFARMPYWLGLLAEARLSYGELDKARTALDAAMSAAEQHDDRWWLPEVLRLRSLMAGGERASELLQQARRLAEEQHSLALVARCAATAPEAAAIGPWAIGPPPFDARELDPNAARTTPS